MIRLRISLSSARRALCAILAACCAGAAWARPPVLQWADGGAWLREVLDAVRPDQVTGRALGFGDVEWYGHDEAAGAEEEDEEVDADEDPPMDDEGRVLATRRAGNPSPG